MLKPTVQPVLTGAAAQQEMHRLTRRSFNVGAAAALAGLGAWTWLTMAASENGVPWPLRRILRFNQRLAEGYLSNDRPAPTFPAESVQGPARTNGLVGLTDEVSGADWRLRVQHEGRADQAIPLGAVQALPRSDLVTELKCVEGWSEVMHFAGVRFVDFATGFALATRSGRTPDPARDPHDLYRYVYLATPDESYYVGLDVASALHPQTLLCDTMGGEPLSPEHGAPVRLVTTVKYGIKNIKWLGLIRFQDRRPTDFWTERGYDWYAGL